MNETGNRNTKMTAEFATSVTPRNRANFRRLKTNSIQSVKRWEKENELLYAMMEDESEWLAKLFPDVVINSEFFFYALEDGSVLCRLANYIQEKAEIYGQKHNTSVPGKKFRYHSMSKCGREIKLFRSRENVQQFLTWCRSHGLPEAILFESNDVVQVDECREGCRGVIICLMEIVRRTLKFELDELPQLIQMEKEIEDEEARADTDLDTNGQQQMVELRVESLDLTDIDKLDVQVTESEAQSPKSLDSDSGVDSVFDQEEGENSASRLTEFTVEETVETTTTTTRTKQHSPKAKKDPKTLPKRNEPPKKKELPSLLESTEPKTELDKQVCKIAKDYNIKLVHRLKEGKYIILGRIMFVRMLNDHMLVRIGGGWDTLEHYIMTHAPKQVPDIPQSPTPQRTASPRNSISSSNSGSLNSLVDKVKRKEQLGVIRDSPVILPQGNQLLPGSPSSKGLRDRGSKKLSITEKDEKDITDAIRKISTSVEQNLNTRPASFTSKTFYQLKSRFDKGIFGSSRRTSSPDLIAAQQKKAEIRRLSYSMAAVSNEAIDGVSEMEQETTNANNNAEMKQLDSENTEESVSGKVTIRSETPEGDLLGEELAQQTNATDFEHAVSDETDGSAATGGLITLENASETNWSVELMGGHVNGNENYQEKETTVVDTAPFDPFALQETHVVEDIPLNPSTPQEPNVEDTSPVESAESAATEGELISFGSAPPVIIDEHPVANQDAEDGVESAPEAMSEAADARDGFEETVAVSGEPAIEPLPVVCGQESTPEIKIEETTETQNFDEHPENGEGDEFGAVDQVAVESAPEPIPEPSEIREEITVAAGEPAVESSPVVSGEEVAPEVDEPTVESSPVVSGEEVKSEVESEEIEERAEEVHVIEEVQPVEPVKQDEEPVNIEEPGKQEEEPVMIEEGSIEVEPSRVEEDTAIVEEAKPVVKEEVSGEAVLLSDEPATQEQTQEEAKEEQAAQVQVDTQTKDEKSTEEAKVEDKTAKKEGKTKAEAGKTRPKSPPKAAPAAKTTAAKKPAWGARPSSPTKPPSTAGKRDVKSAPTKTPATSKPAASKVATKTASSEPAKKPAPKTTAPKTTAPKSEPAKKPEVKSAAATRPTSRPTGTGVPKRGPAAAKAPGKDVKDAGAPKTGVPKPAPARPASQRTTGASSKPAATKPATSKPSRPPSSKPTDSKDGAEAAKKPAARPQSARPAPKTTTSTTTVKKTTTTTTTTSKSGAAPPKTQTTSKTVTQVKNGQQKTTTTTVKKEANGKTTVKETTKKLSTRPAPAAAKKAIEPKPGASGAKSKPGDAKPATSGAKSKIGGKPAAGGKPSTKPATKKKADETPKEEKEKIPEDKPASPTEEQTPEPEEVKERETAADEKEVVENVEAAVREPPVEMSPEEKSIEAMPDLRQAEQETKAIEVPSGEFEEQSEVVVSSRTTTETIVTDGEECSTTTEEVTIEQSVGES